MTDNNVLYIPEDQAKPLLQRFKPVISAAHKNWCRACEVVGMATLATNLERHGVADLEIKRTLVSVMKELTPAWMAYAPFAEKDFFKTTGAAQTAAKIEQMHQAAHAFTQHYGQIAPEALFPFMDAPPETALYGVAEELTDKLGVVGSRSLAHIKDIISAHRAKFPQPK